MVRAGLCTVTQAAPQQTPAQQCVTPSPGAIAPMVAFANEGFLGDHIDTFGNTADWGKWDPSISSTVILEGHGEFFHDDHVQGTNVGE